MNSITKHFDFPSSAVFRLTEPNKRTLNYGDFSKSSLRLFGVVVVLVPVAEQPTYATAAVLSTSFYRNTLTLTAID